ncbi:nuclear transport factor 2 family protein [Longispora urticae]
MTTMDDIATLTQLNDQFIEAFRKARWEILEPVLTDDFRYLDGRTGELWDMPRYIADLTAAPLPTIDIDQVVIHVAGDVAVVSARSFLRPGRYNRYVDSYRRTAEGWRCFHACVWPLP